MTKLQHKFLPHFLPHLHHLLSHVFQFLLHLRAKSLMLCINLSRSIVKKEGVSSVFMDSVATVSIIFGFFVLQCWESVIREIQGERHFHAIGGRVVVIVVGIMA